MAIVPPTRSSDFLNGDRYIVLVEDDAEEGGRIGGITTEVRARCTSLVEGDWVVDNVPNVVHVVLDMGIFHSRDGLMQGEIRL